MTTTAQKQIEAAEKKAQEAAMSEAKQIQAEATGAFEYSLQTFGRAWDAFEKIRTARAPSGPSAIASQLAFLTGLRTAAGVVADRLILDRPELVPVARHFAALAKKKVEVAAPNEKKEPRPVLFGADGRRVT